ncbi:MAG: GGDEF domain-containing protein [Chromatiales bacterium]|nr:GGDEF domain-containing protein [Chromatiales bacterium]
MPTVQAASEVGALAASSDSILASRTIEALSGPAAQSSITLQLTSALQATLDMEELIGVFSQQIQQIIPHGSLAFENRTLQIACTQGESEKESRAYQLVVASQVLGQLTVTRNTRFTDAESELLEQLLSSLVYPLRNAIMYRSAVMAALKDPLTGIYNRTSMNSALIRETELARRHGAPLSLIALDLDHFKKINDSYGHLAGDHVLKSVAATIAECTRSSDMLFRYGGEEFLVLASNTAHEGAMMLAERIRRGIESFECRYGEHLIPITTSLGVACFRVGDDSETLFEKADVALYAAKAGGRNCVRFND